MPSGSSEPVGVYPPIFSHKTNPSSDARIHGGGPYSLRATTITLEDCTANDLATTFGLEPSATYTCAAEPGSKLHVFTNFALTPAACTRIRCASNSVCGVEATCEDFPVFIDAATGAVSDVRTTAVCSCGGQLDRYVLLGVLPGAARNPIPTPAAKNTLTKAGTRCRWAWRLSLSERWCHTRMVVLRRRNHTRSRRHVCLLSPVTCQLPLIPRVIPNSTPEKVSTELTVMLTKTNTEAVSSRPAAVTLPRTPSRCEAMFPLFTPCYPTGGGDARAFVEAAG